MNIHQEYKRRNHKINLINMIHYFHLMN